MIKPPMGGFFFAAALFLSPAGNGAKRRHADRSLRCLRKHCMGRARFVLGFGDRKRSRTSTLQLFNSSTLQLFNYAAIRQCDNMGQLLTNGPRCAGVVE
ncbi:MAG: hypothetical protein V5B07_12915, partial [Candidatus Accumulibacter sp. UW27]